MLSGDYWLRYLHSVAWTFHLYFHILALIRSNNKKVIIMIIIIIITESTFHNNRPDTVMVDDTIKEAYPVE